MNKKRDWLQVESSFLGWHPRPTTSVFDKDQPYFIVEGARRGDREWLASLIETGCRNPALLAFAADIVRGKVKFANNRRRPFMNFDYLRMARKVRKLVQQGEGREKAIDAVADNEGVSRRTVQRALKWTEGGEL